MSSYLSNFLAYNMDEDGGEWFGIHSPSGLHWLARCETEEDMEYFQSKIWYLLKDIIERMGGEVKDEMNTKHSLEECVAIQNRDWDWIGLDNPN